MTDIVLNPLDKNRRKTLQIAVVALLIIFLVLYFLFSNRRKNDTVVLTGQTLTVFDDTYMLKPYPDKVLMHYPYLLIVQADKPLTTVYNLKTKRKEKEIKEILLDYYQGNIVYNKDFTYINGVSLDKYCDVAYTKTLDEILCIIKQERDSVDNMLISINPKQPNLWKRVYKSGNLLTTISVVNGHLYIGEIDRKSKQNYISVEGQKYPVENTVGIIYPLDGKPYFASFPSAFNNNSEAYYMLSSDSSVKKTDRKIVFYE